MAAIFLEIQPFWRFQRQFSRNRAKILNSIMFPNVFLGSITPRKAQFELLFILLNNQVFSLFNLAGPYLYLTPYSAAPIFLHLKNVKYRAEKMVLAKKLVFFARNSDTYGFHVKL